VVEQRRVGVDVVAMMMMNCLRTQHLLEFNLTQRLLQRLDHITDRRLDVLTVPVHQQHSTQTQQRIGVKLGESVALLVARRTNNRKIVDSTPAKVMCITVLTGNRLG